MSEDTDTPTAHQRVWFVTGSSRGLGRALITAILDAGDLVDEGKSDEEVPIGVVGGERDEALRMTGQGGDRFASSNMRSKSSRARVKPVIGLLRARRQRK